MKRHLHNSLRVLLLSLAVLLSLPMLAEQVEIDGINYELVAKAKQATVIANSSGEYSGEVVIAESVEYEGTAYSVTSIGERAFEWCSGLTSVTIPNSVTSIADYAFASCSGLTSVTIPKSVTSIGVNAFSNCSGLTSVHISDIAAWCNIDFSNHTSSPFYYAHHLYMNGEEVKDLVIPNSVTSIGRYAYINCSGLTSVTIPNSVKSIGVNAFDGCSGLTSVTIPNSVTSIGDYAFEGCSALSSVTIGNSVMSIWGESFANCAELLDVYCYAEKVPSAESDAFSGSYPEYATLHVPAASIESYKTTDPWRSFGNIVALASFSGEVEIDGINYELNGEAKQATVIKKSSGKYSGEVVIPESVEHEGAAYSVTRIGDNAFCECYYLTSVTIPNSVTSIGDYAFYDCDGLTSVHISDIATWFNIDFEYYSSNPLCYAHHLYLNGEEVKDLVIPNSVTSIRDYAFWYCYGLTSVTIPNSVTSIGHTAFEDCSGLTSVTIPNSVTSIESSAFEGCSGLTSIVVEDGNPVYDSRNNCNAIIETATNTLHSGCKTTIIPNSVTSIGDYAFSFCSGLTSVTIPNSVTSIGWGAFNGCSGLTSVTIPNSVTSIGGFAFVNCFGLTSVTIGNGVESIWECAFANCPELLDVYCYAENVPSTESNTFESSPIASATLHVRDASINSYRTTEPWSVFGTITSISGTVTLTDGEEFENNIEQEVGTLTYTRTLSKTNTWNALYVPFEIPMTAEFCQNYDVAYFNDVHCYDNYVGDKEDGVLGQDGVIDGMDMEVLKAQEGSVLNANYPYLIRAKNTDALNMNIKVEDATLYSAKETTISCSSVFMRFDVTGIYTTQTAGELKGEYDVYAISGGGWKQALNANQQLKPFRLYLKLTSIDGSPVKATEGAMSRINIRVQGEDTETGIDELKGENGNVKTEIFDLSGRRVQKAQRGIFIQNGKKVIM